MIEKVTSADGLIPIPGLFAHRSLLHGQAHVARVMVHAFRLLEATGWNQEAARLWAAVFLHDLARTHDGVCRRHGADAVRRLHTELSLRARLDSRGVKPGDLPAIELAVTVHCLPNDREPKLDDAHGPLVALLKDADGLDRVRLGDLNPAYLRLPETQGMTDFAEELFRQTDGTIDEGESHFERLLARAEEILGSPVPIPLLSSERTDSDSAK